MAEFDLKTSGDAIVPLTKGAIVDFDQAESVNFIRIVNTTNSNVTVTLWLDKDGPFATTQENILPSYNLGKLDSKVVEVFANVTSGARLTGEASAANAVAIHWTSAIR